MNRTLANSEPRSPLPIEEREAILRELESVVGSPYFCNSKRYPALLRHIVENALSGRSDRLKERTLGIEVFDRPPTYDTNADTVVRYTAGEVRKRLHLYYSEHRSSSGIRISLPSGSYVPEFLPDTVARAAETLPHGSPDAPELPDALPGVLEAGGPESSPVAGHNTATAAAEPRAPFRRTRWLVWFGCAAVVLTALGIWGLLQRSGQLDRAVENFWAPVLRDQRVVSVCLGGVIFQDNAFSGVITAGKDSEYSFVSMQAASAISQISALIDHSGASARVLPAPTTPVSDLREHPVILLGAYNNKWTMRLLQSAPYRFTSEPVESIVNQNHPEMHWQRDRTRPYSSTDDYAVVARLRDSITGQWVMVLAGLGRNGTEAAAQFTTSPRYMRALQSRAGVSFASDKNFEAVLSVHVIEGKTGAPSIEAVSVW